MIKNIIKLNQIHSDLACVVINFVFIYLKKAAKNELFYNNLILFFLYLKKGCKKCIIIIL